MLVFAGMTAIDTSVAGVTVRPADPEMLPSDAPTVADPWPSALARPFEPEALLIDAIARLDDPQATELVRSLVELSV